MYQIKDFQYIVSFYCPGRCVNCGIWKYDKKSITNNEINLDILKNVLKGKMLEGVTHFQLTGGEVQLSPKYIDVVKLIAENRTDASFHTNISGWYPERHYAVVKECLNHVRQERFRVDISLDGKPENYYKIRLVRNGWDKVMETTRKLKTLTNNLRYVFTIYKQNYEDMEWIIEFASEMGVGFYFEFPRENVFLNNHGTIKESIAFTDDELDRIELILTKTGFIKREDRKIKWIRAKSIYLGNPMPFECYAGKESIVIDPYGNVYPCLEMFGSLNMGNLKEVNGDFDRLLESDRAYEVLKHIENKGCQPCSMLCIHRLSIIGEVYEL